MRSDIRNLFDQQNTHSFGRERMVEIEIDKALEQQYGVLSFEAWRERHSEMSGKGPTSDIYTA